MKYQPRHYISYIEGRAVVPLSGFSDFCGYRTPETIRRKLKAGHYPTDWFVQHNRIWYVDVVKSGYIRPTPVNEPPVAAVDKPSVKATEPENFDGDLLDVL
jgi:hypothetical protein